MRTSQTNRLPPYAKDLRLSARMILALSALAVSVIAAFYIWPSVFTLSFSAICVTYSALRFLAGISPLPSAVSSKPSPKAGSENLPTFSILLPVYREAHMIEPLLSAVLATDYPHSLLDIIIICEPHDPETIAAARSLVGKTARIFVTDGTGPQTKPNALNGALAVTQGDIVTVYDAEDRPDPAQLHAAASSLMARKSLGVVQAPLLYYNSMDNWMTKQFAIEYAALFMVWLPFLAKLNVPFPLGGTSNHIRRTALDSVGGWDAYNVTEDADLSFRLAAAGWELGYITPPTWEEAVKKPRDWINQRSRWMKGYMQTYGVHMTAPAQPSGPKGRARFLMLHLTVGVTLMAGLFHVPSLYLTAIIWMGEPVEKLGLLHYGVFGASLLFTYAAGMLIGAIGAVRAGMPRLIWSTPWMPFYWLALFPPTLIALYELKFRPFYWHKTEHGDRDAASSAQPPSGDQHAKRI